MLYGHILNGKKYSINKHFGSWWILEDLVREKPVLGSQIVQWGRIKTTKATIRRTRLGKGGGGRGKN